MAGPLSGSGNISVAIGSGATRLGYALAALIALGATPAVAGGLVDCPSRDAAFSTASPLIDILLSPAARAELDRTLPGLLDGFPSFFSSTRAPSFASIITVKEAVAFRERRTGQRASPVDLAAFNRRLASIPVTRKDRRARCERFDTAPVKLSPPAGAPRILLFEKVNGYRDGPSIDAAHAAVLAMAQRRGWSVITTDRGAAFTPANLRRFDVVFWNNVSGDVLTLSQRRAFERYMRQGGGYLGIHGSAGDPVYFWDWYADTLIGARFLGHPMNPQFQTAHVRIEDATHPIAQGLPAQWDVNDEWYSFKASPRKSGSHIIATLDEASYSPIGWPGQDLHMNDHPIAWTRCIGKGRAFYAAIGHLPERYSDSLYVQMLEQAVAWTAGHAGKDCDARK